MIADRRIAVLVASLLAGCASSPAASEGAATAASAGATSSEPGRLPIGSWLVVRSTSGRGLTVGSGVRLRVDGFDVVSGNLSQAMDAECSHSESELRCTGGGGDMIAVAAADGTVAMQQGPVELVLERASDTDVTRFAQTLADGQAQRRACGAAAECCIAAENRLGIPCDLNALLGDRSLTTCSAGLVAARGRFPADTAPSECQ